MGFLQNKEFLEKNKQQQAKFSKTKTNNAIGMYSGGLDSILAALLIRDQGYNVHLVHFVSPFFGDKENIDKMRNFIESLGMYLLEYPMPDSYIDDVLYNPHYGHGKAINPCIDCHGYMFKLAAQILIDMPADFVFTGEVIGQRPMSQNKTSLHIVEVLSGLTGRLIRPLSAQLMKETLAEKEGWIDRKKLLDISGRGRKVQTELAEKYNLKEYPQPAGGCHFTDRGLRPRFKALNSIVKAKEWDLLSLLRLGRHFIFKEESLYLIIARDEKESFLLDAKKFKKFSLKLEPAGFEGAIALIISKKMYQYGSNSFLEKLDNKEKLQKELSNLLKTFARYTKAYKAQSKLDIKLIVSNNTDTRETAIGKAINNKTNTNKESFSREIIFKNILFYGDAELTKYRV